MSDWALRTLRRIVRDLDVYEDGRLIAEDVLDSFVVFLELVYRDLISQQMLQVTNVHLEDGTRLV